MYKFMLEVTVPIHLFKLWTAASVLLIIITEMASNFENLEERKEVLL